MDIDDAHKKKLLAQLCVFPGSFSAGHAAEVVAPIELLGITAEQLEEEPFLDIASAIQHILIGLLNTPGEAEVACSPDGALWSLAPQTKAALLQEQPVTSDLRLRFAVTCLDKVLQNDAQKHLEAANFRELLCMIATGGLQPAELNYLGIGDLLCRACDRMFHFCKYWPVAVQAFQLLLQHPHAPACPNCIFHMYPVYHSCGLFAEMEQHLALIPQRGYSEANMLYNNYNVYLDYLTCLSYCQAIQGKFAQAEHNARAAMQHCAEHNQSLNNANNLVFALRKQGKLQEAEATCRQHMQLHLDGVEQRIAAEAHLTLGNVLRAQGKLQEACQQHQQALDLAQHLEETKDVDDLGLLVQYHAAKTFMRLQDLEKAAEAVVLLHEAMQTQLRRFPGVPLVDKIRAYLLEAVVNMYTIVNKL